MEIPSCRHVSEIAGELSGVRSHRTQSDSEFNFNWLDLSQGMINIKNTANQLNMLLSLEERSFCHLCSSTLVRLPIPHTPCWVNTDYIMFLDQLCKYVTHQKTTNSEHMLWLENLRCIFLLPQLNIFSLCLLFFFAPEHEVGKLFRMSMVLFPHLLQESRFSHQPPDSTSETEARWAHHICSVRV